MVERLLYTQDVGGSIPSSPTSLRAHRRFGSAGSFQAPFMWGEYRFKTGKKRNGVNAFIVWVWLDLQGAHRLDHPELSDADWGSNFPCYVGLRPWNNEE